MDVDAVAQALSKTLPKLDEMTKGVTGVASAFLSDLQNKHLPACQEFVFVNRGVLVAVACTAATLYWALVVMDQPKPAPAPTPARPSAPVRAATPTVEPSASRESTPQPTRHSARSRSVSVEPSAVAAPAAPASKPPSKTDSPAKPALPSRKAAAGTPSKVKPGKVYTREELESLTILSKGEEQIGLVDILKSLGLPMGTDAKSEKIRRILERQEKNI